MRASVKLVTEGDNLTLTMLTPQRVALAYAADDVRTGYFRENFVELAKGLLIAVERISQPA